MFDNCIMMINIYNKLFNSLFTNKELAQDTSHSACANKKKVLEFTFWTTLLSPASWSLHVGAVQVWSEISTLVVTPMGPSLFPHVAPQMPAQKPRWRVRGSPCAPASLGNCRMPPTEAALSFGHSDSPSIGWVHGQWRQRLLFHCSWGHGDLGEESMGSQRKTNPSGVSGLCWFMSVLRLPIIP